MSPETLAMSATRDEAVSSPWNDALVRLVAASAALGVATWRDWLAMADQWWNVSTYNHILLVPMIVAWLVYTRREQLAAMVPIGWWPGLVPLVGALSLWLVGSLAGVNIASQLGAVASLVALVLISLGPRIALACAFPLAYLLFLVPFGDELVPTMQMVTAAMVIWLTELSGIPAVVDGVFIDTPAGLFEVAEACSGVKFLVAMFALGVLVCYACFNSWRRRAVFMSVAIALPVLANGVRAWGTIYIAQSQGIEFAEGFDHIFYGWVFFALVVAVLLGVFWRWFDRDPEDLGIDFAETIGNRSNLRHHEPAAKGDWLLAATIGLIATMVAWNLGASTVRAPIPHRIALPAVPGWQQVGFAPEVAWQPRMGGADHKLIGRYRDGSGREVDVAFGVYAAQADGREAGAAGEGALVPGSPWRRVAPWAGGDGASGDELLAFGRYRRHAATSYRVGNLTTGSAARLKLHTMAGRLLISREPTMTLILSVEGSNGEAARSAIDDFAAATGDRGEWMDRIAGLR